MIRVLLIEDHPVVRQGIRAMLTGVKGIQVIGEASTGQEGALLAREKKPDIIVLDLRLPDTDGLEIARRILRRMPDTKIVVLTAMHNDTLLTQLLEVGVQGYMTKDSSRTELEQAIRAIHSGQRYISHAIASRMALGKVTHGGQSPFEGLSKREMETLLLLAKGLTVDEIAKQLFISSKTVSSYRYRMYEKLGVKNDVGLVKLAIQYGLVDLDTDLG